MRSRPNPTWPVKPLDIVRADLEYEEIRQAAERARSTMLAAISDPTIPDPIWEKSLEVLAMLERKKDALRRVRDRLVRTLTLEYYGMGASGKSGDSGIPGQSDNLNNLVRFDNAYTDYPDESA